MKQKIGKTLCKYIFCPINLHLAIAFKTFIQSPELQHKQPESRDAEGTIKQSPFLQTLYLGQQ